MSSRRRLPFQPQATVPIRHGGTMLRASFPVDLLVPAALIVEPVRVDRIIDVHRTQLITQLRPTGIGRGLLVDFIVLRLMDGVTRLPV